jgi:hypothetical protein
MFTDFYRSFYYGFLIIAAAISLLYFKKVDKTFRWLCLLIILTLISELTAYYISQHHTKPNNIVYHIFTPVEYFMYAMIYKMFFDDKKWTKILSTSIAFLIGAEILNTFFFQSLEEDPTNIMIAESVLLVFLSLRLFINIRQTPVYENILNEGVFWFNSAVLFYYSFDILVWGLHHIKVYLLKDPPIIIYSINLLFSGFLYIVYAASILLNYSSLNKIARKG